MGSGGHNGKDEIGNKYGRLTVIGFGGTNSQKAKMWVCLCECGKIKTIRGADLRRKERGVESCGCGSGLSRLSKTHYKDLNKEDRLSYKYLLNKYKRLYDVSEERWREMLDNQRGCCAICGDSLDPACLDHNHITNEPRGVLCANCNTALGLFKDSPSVLKKAEEYLKSNGYYGPK